MTDIPQDRVKDTLMDGIYPRISLVVAIASNRAIGKDNQLLWHLPNDLKFFKKTTTGHAVIMGRRTFESIGKALPNRRNIVVTRQTDYQADHIETVPSVKEALALCTGDDEVFVIGGGQLYEHTLSVADRVYLTRVEANIEGDTFFPELPEDEWERISAETHPADDRHAYSYAFEIWKRKTNKL